jgi:predicted nucleic acid-binding protein
VLKIKSTRIRIVSQIDLGEASTIALAKEMESSLLLLDDLKATKLAAKLNLKFTGTLGVILVAKQLES